jgi:hypothetical protein
MACPARVAETGQENIETVHEPKPIQATDILCMDQGRRAMENLYGPRTQVNEGACAIKVSMRCSDVVSRFIRELTCARALFGEIW